LQNPLCKTPCGAKQCVCTINEKEINAKIKAQELKIKSIKNKQNVYEIEERILLDNSILSKKDEGSSVAKLKEAGDFYRLRLNEIKQAKLDLSVELDAAEEKIKELYLQMNQTVSKKRLPSSSILITLDAEREINTVMNLSYYITSAGWEPHYDFRLEDISKPMQVVYNANVFQSSGENWENASLRLSTVDPFAECRQTPAGTLDTWKLQCECSTGKTPGSRKHRRQPGGCGYSGISGQCQRDSENGQPNYCQWFNQCTRQVQL
jgi:uncharacterized protein (TIGR02231 family)